MARQVGQVWASQDKPALIRSTLADLHWAAGYYEGEGSMSANRGSGYVSISQNQSWPNEKMQRLFGGNIRFR